MLLIEFECRKCNVVFDCDVGSVSVSEEEYRPVFENKIICPNCGVCTIDEVFLTELGQTQLTQATFELDDENETLGAVEGECIGCDTYGKLDDSCLCDDCAAKLERDLLRKRDWAYSYSAFGMDPSNYEKLRNEVIKKYGKDCELISDESDIKRKQKKYRRKKKSKKKRK